MWYNGEDDPEIAAAIEEERASARSRRHSPKAKKGKGPPRPPGPLRLAGRRGRAGRPANFCRVGGGGRRDLLRREGGPGGGEARHGTCGVCRTGLEKLAGAA